MVAEGGDRNVAAIGNELAADDLRPRGPRAETSRTTPRTRPASWWWPPAWSRRRPATTRRRSSCSSTRTRPGSLLAILQEFAARSINLTKLESRPTKKGLGDYCFLIDLEGHVADDVVADCLQVLRAKRPEVKFLGSYPAAGEHGDAVREAADDAVRAPTPGWPRSAAASFADPSWR